MAVEKHIVNCKTRLLILLAITLSGLSLCYATDLRSRPAAWAQPVLGSELRNFYQVDKGLFRSRQPHAGHVDDLKSLGVSEILNLRYSRVDEKELGDKNFRLEQVIMDARNVTQEQLISALRIIKQRKGPMLVHCHHGADRAGVTMAAYRVLFNNWSKADAIDEMVNGGYWHKVENFPNLTEMIRNMNVEEYRRQLGLDGK